jgi:hypothetical protein
MMDEIKIYEFFLRLNTFLNRQNHLVDKMAKQEIELGKRIIIAKTLLPPEVFDSIFQPMLEILTNRVKTMNEMSEASDGLSENLTEIGNLYKGIVQ